MSVFEWIFLGTVLIFISTFCIMSFGMFFKTSWGAPFVPSSAKTVSKMIEIANIQPGETVFDLGCGDGRLVFAAEKAGAKKSVGIEVSFLVFLFAHIRKIFSGAKHSHIRCTNFFRSKDIHEADVLFVFLLPHVMKKVHKEIFPKLKPGARMIAHAFSPPGVSADIIFPETSFYGSVSVFIKK